MKIKQVKLKIAIILSLVLLSLSTIGPSVSAFTVASSNETQDNISIDVKQIKELADVQFNPGDATPSQALAQTVATLVSRDIVGPNGNFGTVSNAQTVLKYLYPNDTEQQLKGATITPEQALSWLHSMGYTATIINRPLTTTEIKSYLDKSEPIVTILANQNANDWMEQTYAGILYAHDDVTAGNQTLHKSFVKSVNYGEATIQDGEEAKSFSFPDMTNSPDPLEQQSSYKWVSTITDIKQDPTWINSQTISADKSAGVFTSKLTKAGSQSQVEFTDTAVSGLANQYPENTNDQLTKLSAVSLINLYEDSSHQKTIDDLDKYLQVSEDTYVTSKQLESWYQSLGFDFDVIKGRAPMSLTQAVNDSGRLYFTIFNATDNKNTVKNVAFIGTGYINNSFGGYMPQFCSVKSNEQIEANFKTDFKAKDGIAKMQQAMKTFNYTTLTFGLGEGGTVDGGNYAEDETIYNIRAKGLPDPTEVGQKPTSSVSTPTQTSNVKPVTNGNYLTAPNFKIRETQGQEPWCSEYINAAAVNDVKGITSDDSDISAKSIMQGDYPNLSEDELAKKAGSTINDILKVIQDKYGVTADVVNRSLSFAEVKKQIDNGQIVEMEGYDSTSTAAQGSEDNPGHAVAIVGYVMPTNGKGAPYYEVWNPWWNSTFYLSSSSSTYTLGGINYKWARTWYNWRKSATAAKVDANVGNLKTASFSKQSAQFSKTLTLPKKGFSLNTNSQLFGNSSNNFDFSKRLKMNNSNPLGYKLNKSLKLNDISNDNEEKKFVSQNDRLVDSFVSEFSSPKTVQAFFIGDIYGYSTSEDSNGSRTRIIKNHSVVKTANTYDGKEINNAVAIYKGDVDSLNSNLSWIVGTGISLCILLAFIVLVPGGAEVSLGVDAIIENTWFMNWLSSVTGFPLSGQAFIVAFVTNMIAYLHNSNQVNKDLKKI